MGNKLERCKQLFQEEHEVVIYGAELPARRIRIDSQSTRLEDDIIDYIVERFAVPESHQEESEKIIPVENIFAKIWKKK